MPQIVVLGRHNVVDLCLAGRPWLYAIERRREIDRHWQQVKALQASYFNGTTHLLTGGRDHGGLFRGELLASDFKSFIHWRALGHPDRSVRAAGVGAVLWSSDGAVLLGTAAGGSTNAGRTYIFSGVLDERDITAAGRIDVVAGAEREVTEETGLGEGDVARASPWIWSMEDGVWINFAVERRAGLPAAALRQRILEHNAKLSEPEISDVAIIRSPADLERTDIFDNTRQLVRHLLTERRH
jgi:hypothetical protein